MLSRPPSRAGVPAMLGDPALTGVERAVAEMRAGRPVIVTSAAEAILAMPAEAMDDASLALMRQAGDGLAHIVLSRPRLRHLGAAEGEGPRCFPLPLREHDLLDLFAAPWRDRRPGDGEPVSAAGQAALELAHLAYLMPAVVTAPLSDDAAPAFQGALAVEASDAMSYRDRAARGIRIVSRSPVPLADARDSEFVVFRGGEGMRDQVAIVVGRPDPAQPVLTRIHSSCLTGDLFGSLKCDCGDQLRGGVRRMAEEGGGVMLYLDQEGRGSGIANKMRAYRFQCDGLDTYEADEALGFGLDGRHFAMAGVMLRLLDVTRVRLLTNNPDKVAALAAAGIEVSQDVRLFGTPTEENLRYLTAKRDRGGHRIGVEALFGAPAAE